MSEGKQYREDKTYFRCFAAPGDTVWFMNPKTMKPDSGELTQISYTAIKDEKLISIVESYKVWSNESNKPYKTGVIAATKQELLEML